VELAKNYSKKTPILYGFVSLMVMLTDAGKNFFEILPYD